MPQLNLSDGPTKLLQKTARNLLMQHISVDLRLFSFE